MSEIAALRRVRRLILASPTILLCFGGAVGKEMTAASTSSRNQSALRQEQEKLTLNANVITIAAGAPTSTYAKIAEDIQVTLEDSDGKGIRILPTMSHGGGQNLVDLLFLKGVDMALVEQDHLQYFKAKDPELFKDIDQKVRYIAKLYNSEFHLIAGPGIQAIDDLRGKKVNFFKPSSSSAICAETVFRLLGVDVQPTFHDDELALQKLKTGEIAAMARLAGAPLTVFAGIKPEDRLHLVPLDEKGFESERFSKLLSIYAPTLIRNNQYPGLVSADKPVLSIANATVLAVYDRSSSAEHYPRLVRFIDKFFSSADKFNNSARHPKWKELNLAARLQGWQKYSAAQDWLDRHALIANTGSEQLKTAFAQFLEQYSKATGKQLTAAQRESLAGQFLSQWKVRDESKK
jgi:uncharacterized protein